VFLIASMNMVSVFTTWSIMMRVWPTAAFRDTVTDCDIMQYDFLSNRYNQLTAEQTAKDCVFSASDSLASGTEVEIKISKKTKKWQNSWQNSCTQARNIHEKACNSGGDEAKMLVERYIPTCLEGGVKNKTAYIVMHAASSKGIDEKRKELTEKGSAVVFAQLVGALAAMHGVGLAHNHLHEKSAVILDKKGPPLVAFINFDKVVELKNSLDSSGDSTGSTDEIFLVGEACKLASCPKGAEYPVSADTNISAHIEALFSCLKEKWDDESHAKKRPDNQFFNVFKQLILEAWNFQQWPPISGEVHKTKVLNLYHTNFIQANQLRLQQLFPSASAAICGQPSKTKEVPVEMKQEHILVDASTTPTEVATVNDETTPHGTAKAGATVDEATTSVVATEGVTATPAVKTQEDTTKNVATTESTEQGTVQSTSVGFVEAAATTQAATTHIETTKNVATTESTEQGTEQSTSVGIVEAAAITPAATTHKDIADKFTPKETTKQIVEKVTEQATTTANVQTTKSSGKRQMVRSTLFPLLLLGPAVNPIGL